MQWLRAAVILAGCAGGGQEAEPSFAPLLQSGVAVEFVLFCDFSDVDDIVSDPIDTLQGAKITWRLASNLVTVECIR